MNIKEKWRAFSTIVLKELRRSFHVWSQTVIPPIITTTLYFVIFGHVMGQRVGLIGGYPYIQFIAPGLIMLSIINSTYSASVTSVYLAKFQRSIEELLISPMSEMLILLGYMCGGLTRGIVVGALVSLVALFFTHIHVHSWLSIIGVSILASCIFSLAGIINGIFARKFDDTAFIPTFILIPLTYLGGIFFPLRLLSPEWQYLSLFNPIFYIIETFRYGFLGIVENNIWLSFLVMFVIAIGFFIFAWYLLKKGIGIRD